MKILVDAVLFQLVDAESSAAAECALVVERLAYAAKRRGLDLVLLDRGGLPGLAGVETFPFPTYRATEAVADSLLAQKICDTERVDVFVSTGLTVPLTTPTLQLVVGPGVAGTDPDPEPGQRDLTLEQVIALRFAAFVVCTSPATESRLSETVSASALRRPDTKPGDEEHAAAVASCVLDLAPGACSAFAARGSGFAERWTALRHMQAAVETTA